MEFSRNNVDGLLASRDVVVNQVPDPPPGLLGFVTTRIGGASRPPWDTLNAGTRVGDSPALVHRNHERIGALAGSPPEAWARIHMEHGSTVREARGPGWIGQADGLVTRQRDLPMAITVADCFPLFLWAPGRGAALLHCGWRGVARGVVENGVKSLVLATGASPELLGAWMGPGIHSCCYEVSWDVAVQVSPQPLPCSPRTRLSLPREMGRRLVSAGMESGAIRVSGHCTSCRRHLYFSHRRDRGRTGRMLAVLVLDRSYFDSKSSR